MILFHGTSRSKFDKILESGTLGLKGGYVSLTESLEVARSYGAMVICIRDLDVNQHCIKIQYTEEFLKENQDLAYHMCCDSVEIDRVISKILNSKNNEMEYIFKSEINLNEFKYMIYEDNHSLLVG